METTRSTKNLWRMTVPLKTVHVHQRTSTSRSIHILIPSSCLSLSLHNLSLVSLVPLILLTVVVKGHTSIQGDDQLPLGIHSSQFGRFDFDELEEVNYGMPEISTIPVAETEVKGGGELDDSVESNPVIMVSKHGQRYSCTLPELPSIIREAQKSSNSNLDAAALPNISALLEPMRSRPCIHKTEGWWTYEYCHGLYIKQYHVEAGKMTGKSLWLGFFEKETEWDQKQVDKVKTLLDSMKNNIVDGIPTAYHAAYYVNGSLCDITGKSRMTSVKIYCGVGPDKIVEVREKETCNYTLSVQTSRVCSHPLFTTEPVTKDSHVISCSPVLSREDYEEYLQQKELLNDERSEEEHSPSEEVDEEHVDKEKELKEAVFKSLTQLLALSSSLFDPGVHLEDLDLDPEIYEKLNKEEESAVRTDGSSPSDGEADTKADGSHGREVTDGDGSDTASAHEGSTSTATAAIDDPERGGEHPTGSGPDSEGAVESSCTASTPPSATEEGSDSNTNDDGGGTEDEELELAVNKIFVRVVNNMESRSEGKIGGVAKPTRTPPTPNGETTEIHDPLGHRDNGITDHRTEKYESQESYADDNIQGRLEQAASKLKTKQLHRSERDAGKEGVRSNQESDINGGVEQGLTASEGEPTGESRDDAEGIDWEEEVLREVTEDLELRLQETFDRAGIGTEAKIKVKVADDVDADEYVDKLAREQEDSEIEETFSEAEDEDLTPPVPSYLTDSDEDVMREEKIRAFKQATNNIADTLTQWISNLEAESASEEDRQKQQNLESGYEQVWRRRHSKQNKKTNA